MKTVSNVYIKTLALIISLLFSLSAKSHATNSAWLTTVEGEAIYLTNSGKSKKALPFMGVATDTKFTLATNAKLGVMYSSGTRETWHGPAIVIIGTQQSTATSPSGKPIQAATSSSDTGKPMTQVVQVSDALDKFRSGKIGGMRMRGGPKGYFVPSRKLNPSEQQEVDKATQHYKQAIKARNGSHTLDAEWLYISILAEYEQFELMTDIVKFMKEQSPTDPVINELHTWLTEG